MADLALNPDLSLAWRRPGTYVAINYNSPGASSADISKRLLILGERQSTGARADAALYRANSAQDVFTNSGRKSTVARMFQAAVSTGEIPGEIWIGHVDEPSAGTAATHQIKIYGPATAAGVFTLTIAGYSASVGYANGDSATVIGAAMLVELNKLTDVPCTFGASNGLITVTYNTKGVIGEDLPWRINVTPSTGINVGPGDVVYANAVVGATGSATLASGTTTITATITTGQTASAVATAVNTAVNAGDYCIKSAVTSDTLSVYARNDCDIRRTTAAIVTVTGTTAAFNGGAAGATATNGTAGLSQPSLTNLIAAIAASAGFGQWCAPWLDTTSLSALAAHIELYKDGLRQRDQFLHICSVASLATAGAIPAAPTPALTGSEQYVVAHQPDAAQQGYEIAARLAIMRAANDTPARNWDSAPLKSDGIVPLLVPSKAYDPTDINSAIGTYFLTPIRYDAESGRSVIEFFRTTSNSSDPVLHDVSCPDQLAKQRLVMRTDLQAQLANAMLKRSGQPTSTNVTDTDAVAALVYLIMRKMEAAGYFDGADALKSSVRVVVNGSNPSRLDIVYTASVLIPNHQRSVVANRGGAAA